MRVRSKLLVLGVSILLLVAGGAETSLASGLHGTTLWGVGSVSTQMGGTGTAMPLDSLSATLRNPAGSAFFDESTLNFDVTVLNTAFHDEFDFGAGASGAQADQREYPLPNFGFVLPLKSREGFKDSPLSFGFGLGVIGGGGDDWIDISPLGVSALYEIYAGVANLTYKISDNLAIGAGPRLNWALMDLGAGHKLDPTFGGQVGLIYARPAWSFGVSYITSTSFGFGNVFDFDFDGDRDRLEIEEPQQVYFGISLKPIERLIVNVEGRWLGYDSCDFYDEIDWKDIWGVSIGFQYQLIPCLKVRAGYLYNNSPLREHGGFDAAGFTEVSGHMVPNVAVEAIRLLALPLYWEHHVGGGIGWDILEGVTANVGGSYSFEKNISYTDSSGTITAGLRHSFWTVDVGLELRF